MPTGCALAADPKRPHSRVPPRTPQRASTRRLWVFALVSEVMGSNVQVATGARVSVGVMYTPALQSYSEERDQAVAASRLLPSRKSTSMLKPLKTGTDLLR